MSKSQKVIGHCEHCHATLIVDKGDEFYCNRWGCFKQNVLNNPKQSENYDIEGLDKLGVHEV